MKGLLAAGVFLVLLGTRPDADPELEFRSHLEPDASLELGLVVLKDEPIQYRYESDAPVNFVLSRSVSGDALVERRDGNVSGVGQFVSDKREAIRLEWDATSDRLQNLSVSVAGEFEFVSSRGVHRIDPAAFAPAPAPFGILLALWFMRSRR